MRIITEFSTEDSQFKVLFILYLVFLSTVNYRLNQSQPLNRLMDKLYACTILSRKLRLPRNKWKTYNSTLVHQHYIRKIMPVVFMLLNIIKVILELSTLTLLSFLYNNNLTMVFLFQNMISLVSCQKTFVPNHVQVQLSDGVLNG